MSQMPEELLERVAEMVRRHLGLHFPRDRWNDLSRGLAATCRDLGASGMEACATLLLATPLDRRQIEILGRNLTIGETYFFREATAFQTLENQVLPELIARRKANGRILRFWSAACASGEEAYSLAILLRRCIPDRENWQLTLLATDINTAFLHKAEQGIYGSWSFRTEGEKALKELWFIPAGVGRWRVRPELRAMVTFAFHNLAEDPYPSLTTNTNAMDVIFCRNVLMYFSEPLRRQVLEKLQRSLTDGGMLILGAAEGSVRPPPGLERVNQPDLVAYRKMAGGLPLHTPPLAVPSGASRPSPRPPPPPAVAQIFPQIRDAFARGEFAAVCRRGEELRPGQPDYSAAALLVARACANAGRLTQALAWAEQALPLRRLDPETHHLRAMILDEMGRTAEAVEALRTTLYLDHDFLPAHLSLGNIARRGNDRQQAARHFRNALLLLEKFADDEAVPHSEEMRAGRLREALIAALGGNLES